MRKRRLVQRKEKTAPKAKMVRKGNNGNVLSRRGENSDCREQGTMRVRGCNTV